jgi:pantoate--beta-alanine ligase
METIEQVTRMQIRAEELRMAGKIIALVPTMGFFHEGHLELMRVGKKHGDVVIFSIFVNPLQFGPSEDYESYPRDLEGDLAKAEKAGADIAFLPSGREMYPEGFQTKINVKNVTQPLCGLARPGHFDGVTTVVAKLFHIAKPHLAIFGQKDYQQLTVISRMVKDLNMDIQIVGVPTVREADGLAMSSRNSYLNAEERRSALCLKKALDLAEEWVQSGEKEAGKVRAGMLNLIEHTAHTKIDYINICNPITLDDKELIEDEILIALAVKVGKTRLIDNRLINKRKRS